MSSQAVRRIVTLANQLRQERPNQYGVKGAKPGSGNYVKDGWKNAIKTATELYYREIGKNPKAKKPSVTSRIKGDPKMEALYRGWLIALRQLKEKYYKAGLRAVAPAKAKPRVSQRQRLPPTILNYRQTKINFPPPPPFSSSPLPPLPKRGTRTNIPPPLPNQSQKRQRVNLTQNRKRIRPTLLPHRQAQAFSETGHSPPSLLFSFIS